MSEDDEGRRLLRRTDQLLEAIERLNLRDASEMPEALAARLATAGAEVEALAGGRPVPRATGLRGAHAFVFRLQGRLRGVIHSERAGLARANARTRRSATAGVELPRLEQWPDEASWRRAVEAVAQRAHDRSALLAAQAGRAGREFASGEEDDPGLSEMRCEQARVAAQELRLTLASATAVLGSEPRIEGTVPKMGEGTQLRSAGVDVDLETGRVRVRGATFAQLTASETAIVSLLAGNSHRVLSREALLHALHDDAPTVDMRTRRVDVHLVEIRRKLGPLREAVVCVRPAGYQWRGPVPTQRRPAPRTYPRRRELLRAEASATSARVATPLLPGSATVSPPALRSGGRRFS